MLKKSGNFCASKIFFYFFLAVTMGGCAVCPCKNLKKVTSQDDLFGQIYETALNDSCLFKMTAEELQNIWEIPVVENDPSQGGFSYTMKDNKFYDGNEMQSPVGLYVIKTKWNKKDCIFDILATNSYLREYRTLFHGNILPRSLPEVKRILETSIRKGIYGYSDGVEEADVVIRDCNDFFQESYVYYWKGVNFLGNRMLFTLDRGVITYVIVCTPMGSLVEGLE